ncbi:MAG TPA: hypothetical protein VI365_16045 [Trebonia sp.]
MAPAPPARVLPAGAAELAASHGEQFAHGPPLGVRQAATGGSVRTRETPPRSRRAPQRAAASPSRPVRRARPAISSRAGSREGGHSRAGTRKGARRAVGPAG